MNIPFLLLRKFSDQLGRGALVAAMAFALILSLHAETIVHKGNSTNTVSASSLATNSISKQEQAGNAMATNAAATAKTEDMDSDDDTVVVSSGNDPGHSTITVKGGGHGDKGFSLHDMAPLAIIIPLAGIVATFGTPILIVLVVCYYKFRTRRERLATVREYLNKGLPVPPQLLDDSVKPGEDPVTVMPITRGRADMRKGIKYAAIGLGIALALYIDDPRSTSWGWGMIPAIFGMGFIVSGWIETRGTPMSDVTRTYPPAGTPPL